MIWNTHNQLYMNLNAGEDGEVTFDQVEEFWVQNCWTEEAKEEKSRDAAVFDRANPVTVAVVGACLYMSKQKS